MFKFSSAHYDWLVVGWTFTSGRLFLAGNGELEGLLFMGDHLHLETVVFTW